MLVSGYVNETWSNTMYAPLMSFHILRDTISVFLVHGRSLMRAWELGSLHQREVQPGAVTEPGESRFT
jgi:hypothetical protein